MKQVPLYHSVEGFGC